MDNALRQALSLSFCHNRLGFSITACAPRPDSGHGAYARAHRRVVFQNLLLPRIAWCSKLRTLFWGRSLAPFCVPFECSVIVSASSSCGQAEGKKVLVQVLSGTAPRGTIRERLFNRGLVPKRSCCLCGGFFFQTWRKVVDFQGLLLGAFFVPVFGPGLLTCAAKVPISGPKIWTRSRGPKTQFSLHYLCPLLWRPVALELWSGSMNVC